MSVPTTPEPADTITIPLKEYDDLVERATWLSYLEAAGVDNWEGYSHAHELKEADEA